MASDLSDATPEQLLQAAETTLRAGRQVEVDKALILLAWADTFSGDPQAEPDAVPVKYGGPKLITPGGTGTPGVNDLALLEIAIARHEGVFTTRRALADAFDLRHRLPQVWAGVQDLRCETWVARKVASMSRNLGVEQIVIVDTAVAAALDEAPARILEIAEAKVIEADPDAHAERITRNQRRKGVWTATARGGADTIDGEEAGLATVFARIDEADALAHDQMVTDLAAALRDHAPDPADSAEALSMDHWRAEAFAMLADPAAVLAFLHDLEEPPAPDQTPAPPRSAAQGSSAQISVHLSIDETGTLGPLARIEGLGPRLLSQVRDLLTRHAEVTVTPVIDLHTGRSVNGYEHPTDVKRRTELRTIGDMFPHATGRFTRSGQPPDHDHTVAYDRDGPPGQTGDHNDTPLARHHHRGKTHLGYSVFQLGPDRWIWGSPHGLHRLVTTRGTTTLTTAEFVTLRDLDLGLAGDLVA